MSLLREKVWWSGIRGDVEKKILVCHGCQVTAVARNKCEPLQMTPCPPKPFHLLAVDIKGPLSTGEYLLAIIDYYSRFPFIFILRNTDSNKIVTCFENLFCMFGYPVELVSDNGTQFISEETENYLKFNNVIHRTTSPYWPSANGEVDRFNRTLKKTIDCFTAEGKDWKEWLNSFLLDYRSSIHRATGKSPADVLFGFDIKNNIPEFPQEKPETSKIHREIVERDTKYKQPLK